MSGRGPKRKGSRVEREIVARHLELGVHAEPVPFSGAAGGARAGAIDTYPFGRDVAPLCGDIRARAGGQGFATIERWLAENTELELIKGGIKLPRLYNPHTIVPEFKWHTGD